MRRQTARRQQPGVALFPFLAVLICTMGSLIVLLVLVVQQARAGAQAAAAATESPLPLDPDELKRLTEQQEDLQWRADVLKQQREEYAQDLAHKRLELAHLEEHIRELEDQAKKLMAAAEAFKNLDANRLADRDSAQQQLDEMEKEIAAKKDELDKARKDALRRRPAYAIVPYDGPNGTSRRPMYIECTEEGVILQPEGIKLSAQDFQEPMGPGNPLDACLRAIREHWKQHGLKGEPYPLIVVRPDGAIAFGACRSAMKHWESEFGYELVDQDAELKFPPADRQLATTLERSIQDARQRQVALVAAMPKRFGAEGKLVSFRAADNIDLDQFVEEGDVPGGVGTARGNGRGVPGFSSSGRGMGTGPNGASGVGGSGTSGVATNIGGAPANGMRGTGRGSPTGQVAGSGQSTPGGKGTAGSYGAPGGTSATSATRQTGASGQPNSTSTAGTSGGGNSPGGSGTAGSSTAGGAAGGTASRGSASGQMGGTSTNPTPGSGMSGSSGGSSTGSGQSNNVSIQAGAPPTMDVSPQRKKARKAMASRSDNWGLPNSAGKAIAVTRPIRMECHEDRLLLMPERGDGRTPLVVPIEDDLSQNLDAVVAAVWQRMDRWGLSVSNGYWKPVLTIDVRPGGEERFWELQQLLRGSGIEVEKQSP